MSVCVSVGLSIVQLVRWIWKIHHQSALNDIINPGKERLASTNMINSFDLVSRILWPVRNRGGTLGWKWTRNGCHRSSKNNSFNEFLTHRIHWREWMSCYCSHDALIFLNELNLKIGFPDGRKRCFLFTRRWINEPENIWKKKQNYWNWSKHFYTYTSTHSDTHTDRHRRTLTSSWKQ